MSCALCFAGRFSTGSSCLSIGFAKLHVESVLAPVGGTHCISWVGFSTQKSCQSIIFREATTFPNHGGCYGCHWCSCKWSNAIKPDKSLVAVLTKMRTNYSNTWWIHFIVEISCSEFTARQFKIPRATMALANPKALASQ